jgi:undecaprenyl pyrophosphate phosphatase UppP
LAVALVAAAGIVTAIGGRDRDYAAPDRARVRTLIIMSATPLALALLALSALSAGARPERVWSLTSLAYIALAGARIASTLPEFLRIPDDQVTTRRPWVVILTINSGVFGLLFYNAILLHVFWPILVACAFELLVSVYLVLRLLLGVR